MKNKLPLGIKVKDARESAGLTQQELADKAGISQSYIGKVEAGTVSPSLKTLKKIGEALNIDSAYFLEEDKQGIFIDEYQDELSLEEVNLIKQQKFRPWVTAAATFEKEGLTAEEVVNIVKMVRNIKSKVLNRE